MTKYIVIAGAFISLAAILHGGIYQTNNLGKFSLPGGSKMGDGKISVTNKFTGRSWIVIGNGHIVKAKS